MNASRDPKAMAKTLRSDVAAYGLQLSHSQSLEIVAHQLGHADWNTAAAALAGGNFGPLQLPLGWQVAGSNATDYRIGIDPDAPGAPATIQSLEHRGPHTGFATLVQMVEAAPFRGKRLQLSVELSSAHVTGAATIWMRIDDAVGRNIRFDNMEDRRSDGVLVGTKDWTERQIVLNVPEGADTLHYGFYLRGEGQCWSRGFNLREVDESVPVTSDGRKVLEQPMNLNFAEKSVVA
ncbi:glyoxalase superfamily protein [Cognatiyoonia sp. IB215182]|uniref:glyoxalase superfamily protein n=1 Tax=Cognatiyoonia sp. IB215182 TaxID=3097353 RepID=UPI002A12EA29|nr:glyoxalase superfamily protein [Cognatiyoonia sp. IB215182]MDX8351207.1 glyoxalase superfamily protein [Cognatiyoonia sp. IB215182]